MDIDGKEKEVNFFKYCRSCVHRKTLEADDPCSECLTYGSNIDSHKPVKYVKKRVKNK